MGRKRKAEIIANECDKLWECAKRANRTCVNGLPGSAEIAQKCQRLSLADIEYLKSRGYNLGQGRLRSRGRFMFVNEYPNANTGVTEEDKARYSKFKTIKK